MGSSDSHSTSDLVTAAYSPRSASIRRCRTRAFSLPSEWPNQPCKPIRSTRKLTARSSGEVGSVYREGSGNTPQTNGQSELIDQDSKTAGLAGIPAAQDHSDTKANESESGAGAATNEYPRRITRGADVSTH
jgi:hypothetical protein